MEFIQTLDKFEAADYLKSLEETEFYLVDGDSCCDIEVEDREFSIFLLGVSQVSGIHLDQVKNLVSNIVEMDKLVSTKPKAREGLSFELSYININGNEVELSYCGINVNSEWSAYFTINSEGGFDYVQLG